MDTRQMGAAYKLAALLKEKELTLALAESCTAGLLGHKVTSVEGSSAFFTGSIVSYANSVKIDLLGVPQEIIISPGVVSKECAELMALGARERLKSDIGVAVTGIAGPGGGTEEKPVGTVYITFSSANKTVTRRLNFLGDREEIREQAACAALNLLIKELGSEPS